MRKYLARRALYAAVTLLGVSLSIFVILRILPGDPLVAILGVEGHAQMTPADRVRIMADLGLSDPLPRPVRSLARRHREPAGSASRSSAATPWPS